MTSAPGGLRFFVGDTGQGFDQGQAERLFQPFEQADASTTRHHGGSGLGLSICRDLVAMMHGRIRVRSIAGRGSAFSVFVPLEPAGEPSTAPAQPEAGGIVDAPAARVLLAEDHPTNQKVVAMILEPLGFELTIVEDGRAAVAAAAAGAFDLILMDVQMPIMDGLTATTLIRQSEDPFGRRTPIICLTANVGEAHVSAARAAGCDRHLGKPYRAEALIHAVADALTPQGHGDREAR